MEVGVYEAKARLSELIEQASAGREVILTRHGVAVAKIVRLGSRGRNDRAKLVEEIERYSKTIRGPKLNLRRVIDTGRD